VIRTVQPVLLQLEVNQTEAAQTLGASEWTTFWRVIFPVLRPAIVTGALLSFARSLGEFGSVIVVAGNYPLRSQTATVYLYTQVEAGNMQAASGVSLVLLVIAFSITLGVDIFQWRRHHA
jgi:sulfate transport system permease protein